MTGVNPVLFPIIALLWMALLGIAGWYWPGSKYNRQRLVFFFYITFVSAVFCLLWHWPRLPVFTASGFYPGDSLHTLGPTKAAALACLTTVLLLCAGYSSWRVTCAVLQAVKTTTAMAIVAALLNGLLLMLFYWVLLSVVPQFYYMVYLQIFPDLPTQWVVKGLIPGEKFISILFFTGQATLSNHAAGLLGWVLFINAIVQWLSADRKPL